LPAHLGHGFVEVAAVVELAIEMGDEIAGLDAGGLGRTAAERRDHLDRAVVHHHREAQPRIVAVDHRLEPLQAGTVEVRGMRVKAFEHAVDGAFDQLVVVDVVDVVLLDQLVDGDELAELRARAAVDRGEALGRRREQGDCADQQRGAGERGQGLERG